MMFEAKLQQEMETEKAQHEVHAQPLPHFDRVYHPQPNEKVCVRMERMYVHVCEYMKRRPSFPVVSPWSVIYTLHADISLQILGFLTKVKT